MGVPWAATEIRGGPQGAAGASEKRSRCRVAEKVNANHISGLSLGFTSAMEGIIISPNVLTVPKTKH